MFLKFFYKDFKIEILKKLQNSIAENYVRILEKIPKLVTIFKKLEFKNISTKKYRIFG